MCDVPTRYLRRDCVGRIFPVHPTTPPNPDADDKYAESLRETEFRKTTNKKFKVHQYEHSPTHNHGTERSEVWGATCSKDHQTYLPSSFSNDELFTVKISMSIILTMMSMKMMKKTVTKTTMTTTTTPSNPTLSILRRKCE